MGNKSDLEDQRAMSKEQAESWCRNNDGMPYFETSALQNTDVDEAFMSII